MTSVTLALLLTLIVFQDKAAAAKLKMSVKHDLSFRSALFRLMFKFHFDGLLALGGLKIELSLWPLILFVHQTLRQPA